MFTTQKIQLRYLLVINNTKHMNTQEEPVKETIYYPMIGDYDIELFISLEPKQVKQCVRLLLQRPSRLGVWERARIDRIEQRQNGLYVQACSEYGIWIAPLPPGVTAEAYYYYDEPGKQDNHLVGKYPLPQKRPGHLWQSRPHHRMKAQILEAIANGVIEPHLDPAGSTYDGIWTYQEEPGQEYEYFDWRAFEQRNKELRDSHSQQGELIQVIRPKAEQASTAKVNECELPF